MKLDIIILSEESQTEKDKYHIISLICGILKKKGTNELISKIETHRHRKQTYSYQRGKRDGGEDKLRDGINTYALLYIK